MTTPTSDNAMNVPKEKTDITVDEWRQTMDEVEDRSRPMEWVPAGTTVAQSVDDLTHVMAKLLQTHMLIEKHLSDISKAIDRVVR